MYKSAAGLAAKRGYTNVMTFKSGIPGWAKAGNPLDTTKALPKTDVPQLSAKEVGQMLGEVTVVDIRVDKLLDLGRIGNSLHIPFGFFSSRYEEIPRGKKVVLVDHAGKQVLTAGRFLKSKGYQDVNRLEGGLMSWKKHGLSLEN